MKVVGFSLCRTCLLHYIFSTQLQYSPWFLAFIHYLGWKGNCMNPIPHLLRQSNIVITSLVLF